VLHVPQVVRHIGGDNALYAEHLSDDTKEAAVVDTKRGKELLAEHGELARRRHSNGI